VIGFPKTIDNDLRTQTIHAYEGKEIEAVLCPGFPSAVIGIMEFANRMRTTSESHQRICVLEVMGRDAGWLTGGAFHGGAELSLVPEFEMTKERKEVFFEKVKEAYLSSSKKSIVVAVSEGVRWYDAAKDKVDVVYASSELDEYGHPRFGGISGIIASEISQRLKVEARAQITGYYPRSGNCSQYDRRLTITLADKVADLLLREEYGQMPVMAKMVKNIELEEYNTSTIDMGAIGNRPLQHVYYDLDNFNFTEAYSDFLSNIVDKPEINEFKYDFPVVLPQV
jgi:ATP-dependent phosphofructokinase / diphosphate-dependent phosphofructokinase